MQYESVNLKKTCKVHGELLPEQIQVVNDRRLRRPSLKCKLCKSIYNKRHHVENRDEKQLKDKLYWQNNKEILLEKHRLYREANRDKMRKLAKDAYYRKRNNCIKKDKPPNYCNRHGQLNEDDFYRDGKFLRCKLCKKIRTKRYNEKHRAKINTNRQKRHERNPMAQKLKYLSGVTELKDWYVRQLLVQKSVIQLSDIPDSLVDVKRIQLKIYRETK